MTWFCYAERSPDPFGGDRQWFTWLRVVRKHQGGAIDVINDFLYSSAVAESIARRANLDLTTK